LANIIRAKETLKRHSESMPKTIHLASYGGTAKTPYLASTYKDALFLRHLDLCKASISLLESDFYVPATVTVRSAFECSAMLHWAFKKIKTYENNGDLKEIHTFFKNALMGSKTETDMPNAPNVLTGINHLEKNEEYKGAIFLYGELSEFVHPNYRGVHQSYAQIDFDEHKTSFSVKNETNENVYNLVVNSVEASLIVFEEQYNLFGNELC